MVQTDGDFYHKFAGCELYKIFELSSQKHLTLQISCVTSVFRRRINEIWSVSGY